MIIRSVSVQGFRSFRDTQLVDFGEQGLVHLTGRNDVESSLGANGAGKSSLFEAVFWCLYGRTSRSLRAGNIVNWAGGQRCEVSVIVEMRGELMTVTRCQSPNSLTITLEDGEETPVDQSMLEELILSDTEFLYSIYFAQFVPSFMDLSPGEQMRVYSEVLRLDYWEAASDRASKRLRALIGEIDDKHRQAERLMGRLEEKKAHAKEMKRLEGGWKTERRTKLKGLREEEARLDAEYKKVKRTLQRMPVPEPLDTEINEERRLEEKLKERQKAEATAEAEFNAAASELGRARIWGNALAGSVCPTCRQKVDKLHLEKERKKLVKACEETTNEAQLKFRRATAAFNVADKALADLKRALRTKRDENVKRAEALQEADRAFKQLYRNMMEAADAADECEEAVNPYSGPWMLARTEAENIASDLAKTQKAIEDQLAMQAAMEFWVRGFKDIRLFVIEEALAQLELEVNGALHQLGLEDWSIEFSIEKENKSGSIKRGLTVLVNSPMNKEPVPWEAWSGGESQRLRLAGAVGVANLILSRRGVESNVEFWDEPSTWLSEEGIKDMLAVFEQRGKQKEVWLADHRALDFGRFDKTVCVVKDESGSHIQ